MDTMMLQDRYNGCHSSRSTAAVQSFGEATYEIVAHRPAGAAKLTAALEADPGLIAAHALKGLACVILARIELREPAVASLATARHFATERGTTPFEAMLISALDTVLKSGLCAAAGVIDRFVDAEPTNLLAAKLSQSLRFMAGDRDGMLELTTRILPNWQASTAGYGFVLGLRAFALEEHGLYGEAEEIGREAVRLEPSDAWALHAVAHVYEMTNRPRVGADWLDDLKPTWRECNNFGFHVAWHRALFDLELGKIDRVLAIYDAEVRADTTDDFRDVSNAVSLLWRLEQEGVDVGERWDELVDIARRRTDDMSLMFAALHNLIALVAGGDWNAAHRLVGSVRATAEFGRGDQKAAAAKVALPLADLILTYGRRRNGAVAADIDTLARDMQVLGGSHAQRDVFVRTIAMLAAQRGDERGVNAVMSVRHTLKERDRFSALVSKRLAHMRPGLQMAPQGAAAFRP